MNLKWTVWFWAVMIILCSRAPAEIPQRFYFEDSYVTADGPYTGEIDLKLQLYSAQTEGQLLYEDSSVVPVVEGHYVTLIGDDTTFGSLREARLAGENWVQVIVNGTVLEPRELLVPVPFALQAAGVSEDAITAKMIRQGAVQSQHLAEGSITADKLASDVKTRLISTSGGAKGVLNITTNDADARYVNVTGDTMTGPLTVRGNVSSTQYLNPSNSVLDPYSLAIGGIFNIADGYSVVVGGLSNTAIQSSGPDSSTNLSGYAFVGGGNNNRAAGISAIGGGAYNFAYWVSAIGGGHGNVASNRSYVGGGANNVAAPSNSMDAFVGAGLGNKVYASQSAIVGGSYNVISNLAVSSLIGGGQGNILSGRGNSAIVGGSGNTINYTNSGPQGARFSFIGGGSGNKVTEAYGSVLGGFGNSVGGMYGTAGGYGAQALHSGSWVWSDFQQGRSFASVTTNEFAIRASGGVRLEAKLQVTGEARFHGPIYISPAGDLGMGTYTNGMLP